MPGIVSNLAGKTFGRLTVLRRVGSKGTNPLWLCGCLCGNQVKAISSHLKAGNSKSCGYCEDKERYPKEYAAWQGIISRCYLATNKSYKNYGGRGIKVDISWRYEFFNFLFHVGLAEDARLSIDRINNDGNYEPGNVRWATKSEQASNRRPPSSTQGKQAEV